MINRHRSPIFTISNNIKPVYGEQIEQKMRVIANYLIDRMLVAQEDAIKNGLHVNKEKGTLIMEH